MQADFVFNFFQNNFSNLNAVFYSGLFILRVRDKNIVGVERSAGIIFFRRTAGGRKYLVLRSSYHGKDGKINFWDFPKGLLDKGERGIDAAKREALEEAGISKFKLIDGFKETVRYFVRRDWDKTKKATLKFVAMFLAEANAGRVKLSWEHDRYEWLSYPEARKRITKPQMKKALDKAEEFLNG